jgi:hypothetical protein
MNAIQSNDLPNSINPFVGAKAYKEDHWSLFVGRDTEISDIGYQVLVEPVFLVYGESGVGKTSLIQAGLNMWIKKHMATMHYFNYAVENSDEVGGCWDYIFNKFKELPKKEVSSEDRSHQVICFDSFERVFDQTITNSQTRSKFAEFSKLILDAPDISVVLILRSEWLAHLELYQRLLPNNLKARYRIDPLSKKSSQKVIVDIAEKSLHPFDYIKNTDTSTGAQWVINKITNEGDEFVDLTIMQIVCHWIWNKAEDLHIQIISKEEIEKLNGQEAIVEVSLKAEYEKMLGENTGKQTQFRDWLETAITINERNEIASKVVLRDLTPSFQKMIDDLEASHILRRVAVRTKTKAPILYELAHDLWVKVINNSNKDYKQQNTKLPFRDQLINGMLPDNALKKRLNTTIVNIRAKEDKNYARFLSSLWEDIYTYEPEKDRYRHIREAEKFIGLDVLEGELDFSWFSKETYYHLEGVRACDAADTRAYLLWEKDGREVDYSPDQIQSKRYFYYTSGSLKKRMNDRNIKIPHSEKNESYKTLTEYLEKIIQPEDDNTEYINIVARKAKWLEEHRKWCRKPEWKEKNQGDAAEYTKRFYNAVYQLIINDKNTEEDEKIVKYKAIDDLKEAINSEDKHSLINCFEAAILMYYASPELVEKAGLTSIFD